ncbi:MAG: extracellular solute-binding protein [Clostridia bacterium]|nr:extracellular solute-binding protein [Clostridia bacterium]
MGKMVTLMARRWMGLLLFLIMCLAVSPALADNYEAYIRQHADVPAAQEEILLQAASFSSAQDANVLPEDGGVETGETGFLEYTVQIPQDALYVIRVRYFPGAGSGGDMLRAFYVNGEIPFDEAGELAFSRMWNDANRDYKNVTGNQPFPSQVQTPEWRETALTDAEGYVTEDFRFFLPAGENTLRLQALNEGMVLDWIVLTPPRDMPGYDDYLAACLAEGAAYADTEAVKYQAEDAALKSGPSFYPVNDRTSPLSEPYHPSNIVLNCIGDTAWNEPGEWIAWDIDAPQDGLYRLVLRFKQSDLRGLYATRKLTIDGEIPFAEAADLRFYHSGSFQLSPLRDHRLNPADSREEPREFWFYLSKGSHRIALEVTLGEMGAILQSIDEQTALLNGIYRQIIAITGTNPDTYQSYQLFTRIPDLQANMKARKADLEKILADMTALTGSGSERTAALTRLLAMMDELTESEEQWPRRLAAFKECITAMGKSVLDFKDQPMKIDYFLLAGKEMPKVRADGNFFENLWHTVGAFFGSFTNDYNVANSAADDNTQTISVWLSTGRDQFEVIRRLINESFEYETGIRVNLRLINADVLLPSTFTGNGPDVAIQIGNTAPVNFAFRGAALDLKQFPDYEEIAAEFLPAAMESFYYLDGCYALPDQMSFPVMFYRKDILAEMGLSVPDTWEDLITLIPELQRYNMELYLDTAPPSTMGAALSMGNSVPINTVFLSRLFQNGGEIYDESGAACLLGEEEANAVFKWWTQFYTQHGFPRDIDFITRFRLGEVPLGIVDLSTYTRLAVSAPEIRGAWGIAQVPGTRMADGSIVRAAPCVTGASMIIKNAAEKHGTADASWQFLKWWVSGDTQTAYAREMEAILGQAGRYLVANLEAFDRVEWNLDVRAVLREAMKTLRGIPQVPGGYITGRYLNNAFVTVITNYENAADTLYENVELINEEIAAKRQEFGLDTAPKGGDSP